MKNKIRSRAYFKIKRSINSCETLQQLDTALSMIAAHPSIEEINALHQIYNEKMEDLLGLKLKT